MTDSSSTTPLNHKVLLTSLEGVACALLLEKGDLKEILLRKADGDSSPGDIHSGMVKDVVPGLKAAFVELGLQRTGFLPMKESRGPQRKLKVGQRLLLRVLRSAGGDKGPRMSQEVAIPGMSMVLYPEGNRVDFSKKITDKKERERLEELVTPILREAEMGVLLRTAASGIEKERLLHELEHLINVGKDIMGEFTQDVTPRRLHSAATLLSLVEREWLPLGVSEVWVENEAQAGEVERMLLSPWNSGNTQLKKNVESRSLKRIFGLSKPLDRMRYRQLWLPSGGTIVIDETEAMTVIDVNSGKFSGSKKKKESLPLKINLEAAKVIAEQIRLRGIVGIIVVDFIDMEGPDEKAQVQKVMEGYMSLDSARTRILPISGIGLMQMTRQRTGRGAGQMEPIRCSSCRGTGKRDRFAGILESVADEVWGVLRSVSNPPTELRVEARDDIMRAIEGSGLLKHLEETAGIPIGLEKRGEDSERPFNVRIL